MTSLGSSSRTRFAARVLGEKAYRLLFNPGDGAAIETWEDLRKFADEHRLALVQAVQETMAGEAADNAAGDDVKALIGSSEVWVVGRSSAEQAILDDASPALGRGYWLLKAPRGQVAPVSADLGLRRDATWHLPLPTLVAWLDRDAQMVGYGLGLDLTALDVLEESRDWQSAKTFYHSAALGPEVWLADPSDSKAPIVASLSVRRHHLTVLEESVSWVLDPQVVRSRVDQLRKFWLVKDWTGLMFPGEWSWDQSFALEEGDHIVLECPELGRLEHTVRRLDASWAPVIDGGGEAVVKVHPTDNVAVVLDPLAVGDAVTVDGTRIAARDAIPFGHKIALSTIDEGQSVIKYGEVIGIAGRNIAVGEHVHVHNFDSNRGRGDLVGK